MSSTDYEVEGWENEKRRRRSGSEDSNKRAILIWGAVGAAIITIFVVLALILAKEGPGVKIPGQAAIPGQATGVFRNTQYGYELSYPSGWHLLAGVNGGIGEGFTGGVRRDNPLAIAGVRVVDIGVESNVESLANTLDGKMAKSLKNFKKIKEEILDVGSEKALRYTYTFSSTNNTRTAQMQQIMIKNGKAYYLVFDSGAEEFDRLQSEIKQIADSFKLL